MLKIIKKVLFYFEYMCYFCGENLKYNNTKIQLKYVNCKTTQQKIW